MKPTIQYSLFSLFGLTLLIAITLAFAFRQRVPGQNQLMVQLGNEWQIYDVDDAAYGIHKEENAYFLTVTCSTSSDSTLDPPDCKLEFSIPFAKNPKPEIKQNARFNVPVYDEQHGNLNYFYFFGFGDIDNGIFTIRSIKGSTIEGTLKANGNTLMLRAHFLNQGVTRSFD